jgi:hypothetical protein
LKSNTGKRVFELFNRGESKRDLRVDDGVYGEAALFCLAGQGVRRPVIPVRVFGEDIQDDVT